MKEIIGRFVVIILSFMALLFIACGGEYDPVSDGSSNTDEAGPVAVNQLGSGNSSTPGDPSSSNNVDSTPNGDADAPAIESVSPLDGATDIAVSSTISVTFNEAMDHESLTTNTSGEICSGSLQVSLNNFDRCVTMLHVAYGNENKTFTLTPASPLDYSHTYKIRVTTDAKDASGNPITNEYVMTTGFATIAVPDTTAPTVSSVFPADASTNVVLNTGLSITFTEAMAALTVNTTDEKCTGTYQVSSDNFVNCVRMTTAPVASNSEKTYTVTPAANLANNTLYKQRITTTAKDASGNSIATEYTSTGVTTGVLIDTVVPTVSRVIPIDGSTNIAVTSPIMIEFGEAMDSSTITSKSTEGTPCSGSIQIRTGPNECLRLTSVVRNSDSSYTVSPFYPLTSATSYIIKITTDAKDAAGNAMADYTTPTGFTTMTLPVVSSFAPANNDIGVNIGSIISVTLNMAMDVTTITTNTLNSLCSGTVQVSVDGFLTCIRMLSSPAASNGNMTFTLTPFDKLGYDLAFKVKVTTGAQNSEGNGLVSDAVMADGFVTLMNPLVWVVPRNGESSIPINRALCFRFDDRMDSSTIFTNTTGACDGNLQLSSDDFSTCVPMAVPNPISGPFNNQIFCIRPTSTLAINTLYKFRVTSAVRSDNNMAIVGGPGEFYESTFTTSAVNDSTPPTVISSAPTDGETNVPVETSIFVEFSEPIFLTAMTFNFGSTACSGDFQMSTMGNFFSTTCIQWDRVDEVGNVTDGTEGRLFEFRPMGFLTNNENYKKRAKTSIKDTANNFFSADWTQATPFVTLP